MCVIVNSTYCWIFFEILTPFHKTWFQSVPTLTTRAYIRNWNITDITKTFQLFCRLIKSRIIDSDLLSISIFSAMRVDWYCMHNKYLVHCKLRKSFNRRFENNNKNSNKKKNDPKLTKKVIENHMKLIRGRRARNKKILRIRSINRKEADWIYEIQLKGFPFYENENWENYTGGHINVLG